jgi:acetylornithine deacetylase/succinyl-diaminopimelate desuccinylase-like protein
LIQHVIPDKAEMEGTMHAFDEEVRVKVPELMERVVKGVADAHGASFSFEYYRGPDPVVNDEEVARVVEETARELFGEEAVEAPAPTMGGGLLGLPASCSDGFLPGGHAERREGHHPPESPPEHRHRRGHPAHRREDVRPRGHEAAGCGIADPDRSQRG